MIMKGLYGFWVWMKEIFGFGNLGVIQIIDIDQKGEIDEQMEKIQS